MKKNARIVAKDADSRMEISIRFQSQPYYLSKNEVNKIVRRTAEAIALVVAERPLTSYGLSNVKIEV